MKCKMDANQVLKRFSRQIRKEDAFYQEIATANTENGNCPANGFGLIGSYRSLPCVAPNAETKIAELMERKLRFDKPELTLEWDKIQHRERQATIPNIEQSQSITEELVQTLT